MKKIFYSFIVMFACFTANAQHNFSSCDSSFANYFYRYSNEIIPSDTGDYYFNGSDSFVNLGDLDAINSLTVSVLVSPSTDVSTNQTIWESGGAGDGYSEAYIRLSGNTVTTARWNQPISASYNTEEDWFMVTAVFTPTSTKLYINGQLKAQKSLVGSTYGTIRTVNGVHQLGRFRTPALLADNQHFEGRLDELFIAPQALTDSQVENLFFSFRYNNKQKIVSIDSLVSFNGTSDFVELDPLEKGYKVVLSAEVKRNGNAANKQVIWDNGGAGSGLSEALVTLEGNTIKVARWNQALTYEYDSLDFLFDLKVIFATHKTALYVNGELVGEKMGVYPEIKTVNGKHQIGRFRTPNLAAGDQRYFNGTIQNFKLYYDHVVTEDQVSKRLIAEDTPLCDLSLQFDGVDDFIALANLASTDSLAINLWAKPNSFAVNKQVIWDNGGAGSGYTEAMISLEMDSLIVSRWKDRSAVFVGDLDDWFMVTAVFTPSGFSIYLNGDFVLSRSGTYPALRTVDGRHQLGKFRTPTSSSFDERFFGGELAAVQIKTAKIPSSIDIQQAYNDQNLVITNDVAELNTVINVYPNPTSGNISVNNSQGMTYFIIDVLGNEITSGEIKSNTEVINLEAQKAGMYLLSVYDDEDYYSFKVIKE
ncbi:MAG: T9SS type A sorting domain-containing protein [Cytophagales bacterium]|nr:T9SS type A sorting domain-containing protein [Cytophagales bacterium]